MHTPLAIIIFFLILTAILGVLYALVKIAERDGESGDDYATAYPHDNDDDDRD